jgi:hypothetical protein
VWVHTGRGVQNPGVPAAQRQRGDAAGMGCAGYQHASDAMRLRTLQHGIQIRME